MKAVARPETAASTCFCMKVAGTECQVRATTVWPIHEVLEVEAEMLLAATEGELLLDMLESRMIAPPRPRRRRERPVSSRAVFYSGSED
ncbi:MAG: hypothetical protein ACKONH_00440 [Planctomycetia bacterium]